MKTLCSRLGRLQREDAGTSVLELAIVLPVLLTIGLGIFEFGNLIYRQHLIINGVRDAARYASARTYDPDDATMTESITADAQNIATTGVVSGGSNRISWWGADSVTVAYTTVDNSEGSCDSGRCYRPQTNLAVVTVTTSIAYQPLGFLSYLNLDAITLNASHQERVISVR